MKSMSEKFASCSVLRGLMLALLWLAFQSASWAQVPSNFDHVTTGYPLTGVHTVQRCETCHVNGTFKGTPRDCASCHVAGARLAALNVVKTPQHFPTSQTCDTCHNTVTFVGAKFNHSGVAPNACLVCHNGMNAPGKPSGHLLTSLPCSNCHKTTGWIPATGIDHSQFTSATNCITCHNGVNATGKSQVTHILTSGNCIACHNTKVFNPWTWTHSNTNQTPATVTGQCETCHTGQYAYALGAGVGHIPYKTLTGVAITNCDTCHKAGYTTFYPGLFHSNVSISTQCATCHLTTAYGLTGKPLTAIHATVTGNCESCHTSTSAWTSGAKPDHSTYTTATVCANCHNNTAALGMPLTTHIPITGLTVPNQNCITCHSATATTFNPGLFHSKVASFTVACKTCHTGAFTNAQSSGPSHIPYLTVTGGATLDCGSCHKNGYAAFFPGTFHNNLTVTAQCATCHLTTAYGLTGKPSNATHASVTGTGTTTCETCHSSTTQWATGAIPNHSAFSPTQLANCGSSGCHDGISALGKPPVVHIPTTLNCGSCHTYTPPSFNPPTWNHTQMPVTGQCETCHTGQYTYALGVTSNHIPYKTVTGVAITNCDTCHKSGFVNFYPGKFHSNVTISTQCATCHLNTAYGLTGKPATATHATVTGNCESCHKTTASWTATFTHSAANAVGTGTCDTCHNGTTAKGKTLGVHIPYTAGVAKCDSCHLGQVLFTTSFTMNHTVVTSNTCESCHTATGTYISQGTQGAQGTNFITNHIPYKLGGILGGSTLDCKACHTSTTSFLTEKMNHNGSMGAGSGQCTACHASGTNYLGTMQKKSLTHDSPGKTDCSTSGCHKPLGNKGTSYVKWN